MQINYRAQLIQNFSTTVCLYHCIICITQSEVDSKAQKRKTVLTQHLTV